MFVLIYWLKEFPLSAAANHFELRCQLKQLLLFYYKICPFYLATPIFFKDLEPMLKKRPPDLLAGCHNHEYLLNLMSIPQISLFMHLVD